MKICKRIGALLLALILTCSLSVTAFASLEDTGFSDVDADDCSCEAVLWAVENGITVGATATTFAPVAVCTRAQAVTFLYRDRV